MTLENGFLFKFCKGRHNFVKFSKGSHLSVENSYMIKLNDVVELYIRPLKIRHKYPSRYLPAQN